MLFENNTFGGVFFIGCLVTGLEQKIQIIQILEHRYRRVKDKVVDVGNQFQKGRGQGRGFLQKGRDVLGRKSDVILQYLPDFVFLVLPLRVFLQNSDELGLLEDIQSAQKKTLFFYIHKTQRRVEIKAVYFNTKQVI
jgi:hypothetical protein